LGIKVANKHKFFTHLKATKTVTVLVFNLKKRYDDDHYLRRLPYVTICTAFTPLFNAARRYGCYGRAGDIVFGNIY